MKIRELERVREEVVVLRVIMERAEERLLRVFFISGPHQ